MTELLGSIGAKTRESAASALYAIGFCIEVFRRLGERASWSV